MAKRNIDFFAGGYYHAYNRGANREPIFRCDENYAFLERRMEQYAAQFDLKVIAYCLMPNHYHLVLRQDGKNPCGLFVQALFNSYAKAFNKMYDRSGTLFEGPFRALAVTGEEYLVHLCRYVHRNPLDAHLVSNLQGWPHSNYLEWIGQRDSAFVDRDLVSAHFATAEAYSSFVLEYSPTKRMERAIRTLTFE